ncbi:MAG: hypothetical protein J7K13_06300 [Thermoplasmata archaeon]|nr:hypothetical protein [Thermoplasmata archaeon]
MLCFGNKRKKANIFTNNIRRIASIIIVLFLVSTSAVSIVNHNGIQLSTEKKPGISSISSHSNETMSFSNSEDFSLFNGDNLQYNRLGLLSQHGIDKLYGEKNKLDALREKAEERIQNIKEKMRSKLQMIQENAPHFLSKLSHIEKLLNGESQDNYESYNSDLASEENVGSESYDAIVGTLDAGSNNENNDNITMIPEAGHIIFIGHGEMEINYLLNISGRIVSLKGHLLIGPNTEYLEIAWNKSRGYFEISADGYFELSNFYFSTENTTFAATSIIADTTSHILIDNGGYLGNLSIDGLTKVESLHFNAGNDGTNFSISGTFDFSQMGEADHLTLAWNETGISGSGSFVGNSRLTIQDFSFMYKAIFIDIDSITMEGNLNIGFTEEDGDVLCTIASHQLLVEGIYIEFGDFNRYLDSIEVDGTLNIILQSMDPNQYIAKENGHISIGGCFALHLNSKVMDVEGTVVEITGTLVLNYGYLDIWWNRGDNFFKMNASTMVEIKDFSISVDDTWLSAGWKDFVIYQNGYILLNKISNDSKDVYLTVDGCSQIVGLHISGSFDGFSAGISIGSISFIDGSLFETTLSEKGVIMDLDGSVGYGLIIHDLDVEVLSFDVKIGAIIVMGSWHLIYNDSLFKTETQGFIEIIGFSVSNTADGAGIPIVSAGYFSASGEAEISIVDNGTLLIGLYSMQSYLYIGSAPMVGSLSLELYGDARLKIDLVNREIYGSIRGYGTVNTGSIGLGSILICGVTAWFNGGVSFSLVGNNFTVGISVDASFVAPFSVDLNTMLFDLNNFNLEAYGIARGYVSGGISASINLATGDISIFGSLHGTVLIQVTGISGYGKGVWGTYDVNDDERTDIYLYIDEISVDFTDTNLNIWFMINVQISSLSDVSVRYPLCPVIWGTVKGTAEINGLYFRATSSNSTIPGILSIDHLEFDADFAIHPSDIGNAFIEGNASLSLEGFNYTLPAIGLEISFDSLYIDGGYLEIRYENPIIDPETGTANCSARDAEIRVDGSGAFMALENLNIDTTSGVAEAHIASIALSLGEFTVYFGQKDAEPDTQFVIQLRDGIISIEGVNASISSVVVTIDRIDINFNGELRVYKDGTLKADAEVSLNVENLELNIFGTEVGITSLNVKFNGELIISPSDKEDKPPLLHIKGYAVWNSTGDIKSEGFIDGDVYIEGNITVDWVKDENGLWKASFGFDGEVYIDHFYLIANIDTSQFGKITIEVRIDKYWGTGLFDFEVNLHNGEIYMNNQRYAVWQTAYFEIKVRGTKVLSAMIKHFWGDIKISDIKVYYEDGKINYRANSVGGCLAYLGFMLSSDTGFKFEGDLSGYMGPVSIHLTKIELTAGTKAMIETYIPKDDPDNIYMTVVCTEGDVKLLRGYVEADGVYVWFEIGVSSSDGPITLKFPKHIASNIKNLFDALKNKDWKAVAEEVTGFLKWWRNRGDRGDYLSEGFKILDFSIDGQSFWGWVKEHWDELPWYIKELLRELYNEMRGEEEDDEGSCFLAGTKIEMADGSLKNIEDIEVGDKVMSYDPPSGEWKIGTVSKVFHHSPDEMTDYYLVLNHDLRITPNHPVYVDGKWKTAGELRVGDIFNGNQITSIEKVYKKVPTYNFEVLPYHTYNVVWSNGKSAVVHNAVEAKTNASLVQAAVSAIGDKGGNSCFLAGTKIVMADGSTKNIEDIQVGDVVQSFDIENGTWSNGTVVEVFHHSPEEMPSYYLVINNDLKVTPNHPLYVSRRNTSRINLPPGMGSSGPAVQQSASASNDGMWITAGQLQVGMMLDGQVITSIRQVYRRMPTYNFWVEPYHNYRIIWGDRSLVANQDEWNESENGKQGCFPIGHPSVSPQNVTDPEDWNPWGDKSCFLAGTKIVMADGSFKNIEDVMVGDEVRSYDAENGKWSIGKVREIFHHAPEEMTDYYLILNHDLRVTPNHPVYVDGKWKNAGELRVGDVWDGNLITSIERIYKKVPTYNIEVEPYHTYTIVWEKNKEAIVHNANGGKESPIPVNVSVTSDKYHYHVNKNNSGPPEPPIPPVLSEEMKPVVEPYSPKNCLSGTLYGLVDIADAGLDCRVKVQSGKVTAPFEMVPKSYEDNKSGRVVINGDNPILTEDGQLMEISPRVGWSELGSVKSENDVSYGVQHNGRVVGKDLDSPEEVKEYIREHAVNYHVRDENESNSNSCCFPAGTMITMADGTCKPIEDVKVGEYVLSYDTQHHRFTKNIVKEIVSPIREGVYSINNGLIFATDDHPFYVMKPDGRTGWASIKPEHTEKGYLMVPMKLEVGDKLFTIDEKWITIKGIEYKQGPIQTYNLEDVTHESTFFANGILVHNAKKCMDTSDIIVNHLFEISPLSFTGDEPVGLSEGIPIQFTAGGSFITFGNIGVSASAQIFVVNKIDIYPPSSGNDDDLQKLPLPPDGPIPPIPPDDAPVTSGFMRTLLLLHTPVTYNVVRSPVQTPDPSSSTMDIPVLRTADNIYYPAESISPGDVIRAYDTSSGKVVNATVSNVSMTLVEGRYVEIFLVGAKDYEKFIQYKQSIDTYQQLTGSNATEVTPFKLKPSKKLFVGLDQPIYTEDGGFIPARELKAGQTIRIDGKASMVVYSAEIKHRVIPVYNITLGPFEPRDGREKRNGQDIRIPNSPGSNLPDGVPPANPQSDTNTKTSDNHIPPGPHCFFADGIPVGDYFAMRQHQTSGNTCFPQGTLVTMARNSYRNIEQIQPGDHVMSYDLSEKRWVSGKVIDVEKHTSEHVRCLSIKLKREMPVDDSKDLITLEITPNHPVFTMGDSDTDGPLPVTYSVYGIGNPSAPDIPPSYPDKPADSNPVEIKTADELKIGDRVIVAGGVAIVSSIDECYEDETLYNIVVETYHNYLANDVLVADKHHPSEDDISELPFEIPWEEHGTKDLDSLVDSSISSLSDGIMFSTYHSSRDSKLSKEISREKIRSIIINILSKLVERFPFLSKIPFIQKLLGEENESPSDGSNDSPVNNDNNDNNPPVDDIPQDNNDLEDNDSHQSSNEEQSDDTDDVSTPSHSDSSEWSNYDEEIPPLPAEKIDWLQMTLRSIIAENDPDGNESIHYIWDFGDGTYGYGKNPMHVYTPVHPYLRDETAQSFAYKDEMYKEQNGRINETITYLATLLIVDSYGNIVDMDMTSITIEVTWSTTGSTYMPLDYQVVF